MSSVSLTLLPLLSRREWAHHPWRHLMAVLAVALGVALAWSVHVVNASALAEFSAAMAQAQGQADVQLRAPGGALDDALYERVAVLPQALAASPVLEVATHALSIDQRRVPLKLLGLDALQLPALAPALMPQAAASAPLRALFDPALVYANAAALQALGPGLQPGAELRLQSGPRWLSLRLGGRVAAGGPPLLVMDIAAAQAAFGLNGTLTRIDLRLTPGSDLAALLRQAQAPANVQAAAPDAAQARGEQLTRAYRVNLSVLALVALLVGGFLVYSVLALSVAQRQGELALLGVLGLGARQRRTLVLVEAALLGAVGALLGLALGLALAWAALRWLAGDLGSGAFAGLAPSMQWHAGPALGYFALGLAAALLGAWVPARSAERLAPARALKGLAGSTAARARTGPALALLGVGAALALVPPIAGLPLAAYAAVAALLMGGVALVPVLVQALLAAAPKPKGALVLLALQRARQQRHTATAVVAGVVASLALSVALTVMVASFRQAVADWLGQVLPADLYARTTLSSAGAEQAWLDAAFAQQAALVPGVLRVQPARLRSVQLDAGSPGLSLIARELDDPARQLPLVAEPLAPAAGEVGIYLSEAAVALHGAQPGALLALPLGGVTVNARVLGVWRDYARQHGSVAIDLASYRALTGDTRINELALWLAPGTDPAAVQQALLAAAGGPWLDFATPAQLRVLSMRLFDRSFAVTYYLQAVALGLGLVGVAASLSAQVLARRKEFGLLAHLGLTRGQVLAVVCGELAAWLAAGALCGVLLGLLISLVLVGVVNPQSFHWTMDMSVPWARLALLAGATWLAGLATAAFSARGAAALPALRAVRQDW